MHQFKSSKIRNSVIAGEAGLVLCVLCYMGKPL